MRLNSIIAPSLLALVLTSPASATAKPDSTNSAAIPGWPLKVGTNIWTRYEMREGYESLGVSRGRFQEGNFAVYRARLTLRTAPINLGAGQQAQLFFSPQADGFWGNQPSTISNPNLGVYEAFLRLRNDIFRLDVGHFSMNYGDALIIGDLRWHQTARSFDGARIRIQPEEAPYWIDLFFTQLDEGLGGPDSDAFAGDVYFTGMYASFGHLIGKNTTIEPYWLNQIWTSQDDTSGATAQRPAVQSTIGLRALQKYGMIDLRVEAGVQFGKRRVGSGANPDVFAFQVDGEIGMTLAKGFRLSLEGLFASGDDPGTGDKLESYDELFPTTHKFLGLADVIGIRSNVASGVFHIKYVTSGSWVFKLDQHLFWRPETADGQESFAGAESDLNIIYKIGRGMTLRTLYALFVPGSDHFFVSDAGSSDDLLHYVELQFSFGF